MGNVHLIFSVHQFLSDTSEHYKKIIENLRAIEGVSNVFNLDAGFERPPIPGMHSLDFDPDIISLQDLSEQMYALGVVPIQGLGQPCSGMTGNCS